MRSQAKAFIATALMIFCLICFIIAKDKQQERAEHEKWQRKFEEQCALARSEGIPVTTAEFAATISVSEPQNNGAPYYKQLVHLKPKISGKTYSRRHFESKSEKVEAISALESCKTYMDMVDQGSQSHTVGLIAIGPRVGAY